MREFNDIMQNAELTPEDKEKAIKKWFDALDEDKRKGLEDALNLRTDVAKGLEDLSKTYIRYLSYMNPQMPLDALTRKAMYDIQETVVLNDFKADLGNIKGIFGDAWDRLIYEKLQSGYIVNDSRSRGESEQLISALMNMRKSEFFGGAGDGDKTTTQDTQASWRMSDFKDLSFANGRKVSVAGCALGAFNAAITRHGYPPISAQAMLDVANEYLTDDGINMEFFKAMAVKIGWEVTQYKGSENKFTPQNFKSITSGPKSSVILQLQNIDNNGSHYVTLLQYGSKKCQICDPQAQVYKTEILTGDILARLVSVTVLTHPGDSSLKADSDMSKVEKFKKNFKERTRDAVKSTLKSNGIGMAVYGLYKLGKYVGNKGSSGGGLVPTGATNADGTPAVSDESNETQDPIVSKLQEILDKINDFVNVRIIGDDTIALTNTDLESSKTALQMSYQDAKTSKDKNRLHHIRQMFSKPSFQKDQIKKEKVEDAILNGALKPNDEQKPILPILDNKKDKDKKAGGLLEFLRNLGIGTLISNVLSKSWTMIKGLISKGWSLITKGISSTWQWIKNLFGGDIFAGAIGKAITASLKVIGIFGAIFSASKFLGWIAEKVTGIKEDYMRSWSAGNDNFTTEEVDVDGKTKKDIVKEKYKQFAGNSSYIYTDEWLEFINRASDEKWSKDKYAEERRRVIMDIYDKHPNVDMVPVKNESNVPWVMKQREKKLSQYQEYADKRVMTREEGMKNAKLPKPDDSEKGDGTTTIRAFGKSISIPKVLSMKYGNYKPSTKDERDVSEDVSKGRLTFGTGIGFTGPVAELTKGMTDTKDIIRKVAEVTGSDPNLMLAIAGQESGFKATAFAGKNSSAAGLFQFTKDTWIAAVDKYAKHIGIDPKSLKSNLDGGPNDPRFNPTINSFMAAYHLADMYKAAKRDLGRDPLPEEVYMYHGLGIGGAPYYLKHKDYELVVDLALANKNTISQPKYNKTMFYEDAAFTKSRTVGGLRNWFREKIVNSLKNFSKLDYNNVFGVKFGEEEIYEPKNLNQEIKQGERVPASLRGIMQALPVKGSKSNLVVTSAYGPRNVRGGSHNHKGIDIRAYKGAPIFATHSGRVVSSEPNFGLVHIKGIDGMGSRYLHMSKRHVKVGDFVNAGQQIGESGGVGAGGRQDAYGAHLHYEVIDQTGNKIDPFKVLNLSYENLKASERENMAYAIRNGLKSMSSIGKINTPKSHGDEKGDGPVNQDNRPIQVVNTNSDEKAIGTLIKVMSSLLSGVIKQQAKNTEVLTEILSFMQKESRDNFLMSNARAIAKSKY